MSSYEPDPPIYFDPWDDLMILLRDLHREMVLKDNESVDGHIALTGKDSPYGNVNCTLCGDIMSLEYKFAHYAH